MLIARIEKWLLLLVLTLFAIGLLGAQPPSIKQSPRIVFIIGENEYHTWETLPEFAQQELRPRGLDCSFVVASPKEHDNTFTDFALI